MKIKTWKAKTKDVNIRKNKDTYIITNNSQAEAKLYAFHIIKCKKQHVNVSFKAKTINGSGAILKLVNRNRI